MESRKHHYIPKCYLKAWTGADGLLCDYRRPHHDVVVRRRHPSETGWIDRLYTLSNLSAENADWIEAELFRRVDQEASDALQALLSTSKLPDDLASGWGRFLMSLMHRHPSSIATLKRQAERTYSAEVSKIEPQDYVRERTASDPDTLEEYRAANDAHHVDVLLARVMRLICDSDSIGPHILRMHHQVVSFNGPERLLTSDRPLLRAYGLSDPKAVLLLPISPRKLFVITNGPKFMDFIDMSAKSDDVVRTVNRLVARRAYMHVYGVCENHFAMVQENMGAGLPEPWVRDMGEDNQPAAAA